MGVHFPGATLGANTFTGAQGIPSIFTPSANATIDLVNLVGFHNDNVISIWNKDTATFGNSAARFLDAAGLERGAAGYGHDRTADNTQPWYRSNYFEYSNLANDGVQIHFKIVNTGANGDATPSQFPQYHGYPDGSVELSSSATQTKRFWADSVTGNVLLGTGSLVQIGGTAFSASFPAFKRNGAGISLVTGTDSALSSITLQNVAAFGPVTALAGTAVPAGGTTGSGLLLSSTANFGVFFGSGAPSLSAAKGSLYLRSDGSGVADRAYINTNGSTTWTAIATAG